MQNRVLIVIPHDDFRDKECRELLEELKQSGASRDIASTHMSDAVGRFGYIVKPDLLLSSVEPSRYDAVILIGEEAAENLLENQSLNRILDYAMDTNILVGAIGFATSILTRTRLLVGKKVTGPSMNKRKLEGAGGYYSGRLVERDGNLVTASGPLATTDFIAAVLGDSAHIEPKAGREYLS